MDITRTDRNQNQNTSMLDVFLMIGSDEGNLDAKMSDNCDFSNVRTKKSSKKKIDGFSAMAEERSKAKNKRKKKLTNDSRNRYSKRQSKKSKKASNDELRQELKKIRTKLDDILKQKKNLEHELDGKTIVTPEEFNVMYEAGHFFTFLYELTGDYSFYEISSEIATSMVSSFESLRIYSIYDVVCQVEHDLRLEKMRITHPHKKVSHNYTPDKEEYILNRYYAST